MAVSTFEDLEVWKRGCRQAVEVCRQVGGSKNYALRDQMARSGISVPSNIAEGAERDSDKDFIRFLRIAKGSNGEVRTQMYIAAELGEIESVPVRSMIAESKEIAAMLQGLIRSIEKRSAKP